MKSDQKSQQLYGGEIVELIKEAFGRRRCRSDGGVLVSV